ncbi:MAG: hypothetical protein IPM96_18865 [Ignavibacteria bacterium]|nr:hypothetical protein [Ignavibacteria bacterium]
MKQNEADAFNKSTIIQLLRIFTPEEMKEFEKFIRSPFHNNRKDVMLYFENLKNSILNLTIRIFQKKIYFLNFILLRNIRMM